MPDSQRLVAVCGLPGTGKTTVASAVAERLDARLVRTDVVRKDLVDEPEYTAAETRRVYDAVLSRARRTLVGGRSVVLDGTFRTGGLRERARETAASTTVEFDLVKVECDESVVRDRIAAREDDESDADFTVHRLLSGEFESVTAPTLTVDNSGSLSATRECVRDHF